MSQQVVVLGANFGGLTTALSLRHELGHDVDITVVAPSERFLFTPSLIWVPFGKRRTEDISFPVAPTLNERGVDFVHAAATRIDPVTKEVRLTNGGSVSYDFLVLATGYRNQDDIVPGFTDNAVTITTAETAETAGWAWQRFLTEPSDVVIAATQGAGCFGAAYEFLFNMSYRLRKAGLRGKVNLTYVTAEPFLGHFGIGGLPHGEQLLGMFVRKEGITVRTQTAIDSIEPGAVVTSDGDSIPFGFAMVVPPFLGQEVVSSADGLADEKGFVPVRSTYQSQKYDDVYAVGVAAAVEVPWQTAVPVGIPKTGFPTEVQAHVAARNIAAQLRGEAPTHGHPFGEIKAVCVMDAGNNGVVILADRMLPPRRHGLLIPGPQAHAVKLGFEKYFLWKARHGYVRLP